MQTPNSIRSLLSQITYKDWKLMTPFECGYLQWVWEEEDPINGGTFECKSRKWMLSFHMTDSEIVQTAFLALQVAIKHEAREFFKFKGRPVMRPHFDVYKLVELCDLGAVSKREEPKDQGFVNGILDFGN